MQPPAYTVQYPRDLAPLVGDTTLDDSVDEGVKEAVRLFLLHDEGTAINLVGVSQGAVVMARTKRELIDAEGVDPKRIYVLTYGDPTNPDGGFLAKLDRLNVNIPGFKPVTHTPGEGGYVTVVIEYDVIADSPDNLNPVSWANALMGASYDHATYSKPLADAAAGRAPGRQQHRGVVPGSWRRPGGGLLPAQPDQAEEPAVDPPASRHRHRDRRR